MTIDLLIHKINRIGYHEFAAFPETAEERVVDEIDDGAAAVRYRSGDVGFGLLCFNARAYKTIDSSGVFG